MDKIKLTQTKSSIGRAESHKACLRGLGLRGIGKQSVVLDTPSNRGMANKIAYMVVVERV